MGGKLNGLKNIIWAFSIVLCLVAVLVGLIFAAASKYDGEQERGNIMLGEVAEEKTGTDGGEAEPLPALTGDGTLHELVETADAGQDYIDSLTFLSDSIWLGLRDYGMLTAGTATNQVWASSAGNIPAGSLSSFNIVFPDDGSEITPADAALITKPQKLVIALGMDSLANVTQDSFITGYCALINSIHAASPDTVIICCAVSSVTVDYPSIDGLTVDMAISANEWIKQVCIDTGAYFTDPAVALRDSSGALMSEYASANGKALNSEALTEILNYLRTHAA